MSESSVTYIRFLAVFDMQQETLSTIPFQTLYPWSTKALCFSTRQRVAVIWSP